MAMCIYIYIDTQQSPGDLFMAIWRGAQPHTTLPERPFPRSYGIYIIYTIYIYLHHGSAPQNEFWLYIFTGRRAIVIYRRRYAVIVRHCFFFNFQISSSPSPHSLYLKYIHFTASHLRDPIRTACTRRWSKNTWLMHRHTYITHKISCTYNETWIIRSLTRIFKASGMILL